MSASIEGLRYSFFVLWFILFLPLCALVDPSGSGYSLSGECFVISLPLGLVLLVISSSLPKNIGSRPRILLALWLALFLRAAFGDLIWGGIPAVYRPWAGYLVYALIFGVPLSVIFFRRLADLGAVKLTVYTGFSFILAYYFLDFLGELRFIGTDVVNVSDGFDWGEAIGASVESSGWVRLVSYIGLGYLVTRRKGFVLATVACLSLALMDAIIGWLVLLFGNGGLPLEFLLNYWPDVLPEIMRDVLIKVIVLTFFGLLGALIARLRWPRSYSPHLVPANKERYRPARRITSDNKPDSIGLAPS
jgi:hypothetical protein